MAGPPWLNGMAGELGRTCGQAWVFDRRSRADTEFGARNKRRTFQIDLRNDLNRGIDRANTDAIIVPNAGAWSMAPGRSVSALRAPGSVKRNLVDITNVLRANCGQVHFRVFVSEILNGSPPQFVVASSARRRRKISNTRGGGNIWHPTWFGTAIIALAASHARRRRLAPDRTVSGGVCCVSPVATSGDLRRER